VGENFDQTHLYTTIIVQLENRSVHRHFPVSEQSSQVKINHDQLFFENGGGVNVEVTEMLIAHLTVESQTIEGYKLGTWLQSHSYWTATLV